LADDPELYPVLARLGEAYFQRARQSHDPADLAKARNALRRSLAVQENHEALRAMAALCNYSHRFEEALSWARRAAAAAPGDRSLIAMRVEALIGLGRLDEAGALFPGSGRIHEDAHSAGALGMWLAARGRTDEAVSAFRKAAGLARAGKADALAQWSLVSAAGVQLDAGQPAAARPLLDEAARIDPDDSFLGQHRAELQEVEGHPAAALAAYEALLSRDDDAEIHRRAADLARRLGRREDARRHFEAAERSLTRAVDAGEVYTFEALARLYHEAGVYPEQARHFARRNLEFKRDRSARDLAASLKVD
jgi:tetratricopeptide (TPR) repeat protein